ncbi:MAG TPA: DUF4405 domain-containing protein [Magnetospirillum sp.]|nr:DUF4405 domain-containing protein [Magnetospirillum sp.]
MATPAPAATPATSASLSLDGLLRRYATQATTALAVVVGVTGVMMFFHLAKSEVEAMHEWLGMGFAVVATLHAVRHRAGVANMLTQTRMRALLAAAALTAAAFLVLAPAKQGNPFRQATDRMLQAPIAQVAPVLGIPAAELAARLGTEDTSLSMAAIAKAKGMAPPHVLATALAK